MSWLHCFKVLRLVVWSAEDVESNNLLLCDYWRWTLLFEDGCVLANLMI
ncbi:MAG: hypothetical protein ACTJLM_01620 [Ehrlichia sp.]